MKNYPKKFVVDCLVYLAGMDRKQIADIEPDKLLPLAQSLLPNTFKRTDHPDYGSKEWQDYVMSLFTPNELFDGKPNISGLRRLTRELLGDIIWTGPVDYYNTAELKICIYEVHILWKIGLPEWFDIDTNHYPTNIFRAAGEASNNNTAPPFSYYPASMAETRAEARALRKALCLSVVSAEEILGQKDVSRDEPISSMQKEFILAKCDSLKIKLEDLVKGDLDSLTKEQAKNVISQINQIQMGGK